MLFLCCCTFHNAHEVLLGVRMAHCGLQHRKLASAYDMPAANQLQCQLVHCTSLYMAASPLRNLPLQCTALSGIDV
jgi:hypothetical protein